MRAIIYSAVLLVLSGVPAIARDGFNVSGQEWNSWNQSSKMYFVIGWIKCGISASNNMSINMNKYNESVEFMELQDRAYKNEGVILEGITVRQVRDTLDNIYSDPRTTYIDIEYIMPLIVGRLTSGWTLEQLDTVISYIVRIDKCEKEEKQLGKNTDQCSALRRERNAYMSKLQRHQN